jgi:hypothetical protein
MAGGWQHVQLLHNQVAVFAGVVLQYATAGAIPAALHAYDAAECQPSVRCTSANGHLVIWYNSCCGLLHMHTEWYDHPLLFGQEHSRFVGRPFLQVCSSQSISLAYSQRPAAHAIVDLRNVPGFVPDSRWFSTAGCIACTAVLACLTQRRRRRMSLV